MSCRRVALLLLPLLAGAAAESDPAAAQPGLRGTTSAAQDKGACGQLPPSVKEHAQGCFAACPQVCEPLLSVADAWLASHNPAYAVCGAQEQFGCLFENMEKCSLLLEGGDRLAGESLPRSKVELMEACAAGHDSGHGKVGAVEVESSVLDGEIHGSALVAGGIQAEAQGVCDGKAEGWFCMGKHYVHCCESSGVVAWCGTLVKSPECSPGPEGEIDQSAEAAAEAQGVCDGKAEGWFCMDKHYVHCCESSGVVAWCGTLVDSPECSG